MWKVGIPLLCVLAHLYLVLVFLPPLWREIDRHGFRWPLVVSLFVAPLMTAVILGDWIVRNLGSAPDWLLLVAFLTVDALGITMLLVALGLRARRRHQAGSGERLRRR